MWPDRRLPDLFGVEHPIMLSPMANAAGVDLAVAVARAGGLAALPCGALSADEVESQTRAFRDRIDAPLNLNFFCHRPAAPDPARAARWRERLAPYAAELGVALAAQPAGPTRAPFDEAQCAAVERLRPRVVSFHFGLPAPDLLVRVRAAGALILGSATIPEEARWLEAHGCDAIIAQGAEAGGHRGMFLTEDVFTQLTLTALVPQVVDAVRIPVIAAGGIADARGVAAAFALGAAGVQIGSAFLRCPEAKIGPLHRAALASGAPTVVTNVLTGRPARAIANRLMRELGPISADAPAYPEAAIPLATLRAAAEARGSNDFSTHLAGQAGALSPEEPAAEKLARIASGALAQLGSRG